MGIYCTNCDKKHEKGEKCGTCAKVLSIEIRCIKISSGSQHFCSNKCAEKKVSEAKFLPREAVCQKCRYIWNLPTEVNFPVSCPKCEAAYTPPMPKLS